MLLDLALSLAPQLARWVGLGDTVDRITATIKSALGTDNVEQATAALGNLTPQQRLDLQVRLAEIAATNEAAARKAELDELTAVLRDTDSARAHQRGLIQAGSAMSWMPAIISFTLLALLGFCMLMVFQGVIPPENQRMADMLIGGVYSQAATAIAYWVGTSRGAVEQRQHLQQLIERKG